MTTSPEPDLSRLTDQDLLAILAGPRRQAPPGQVHEATVPYHPESLADLVCLGEAELAHLLGLTPHRARLLAAALELHLRLLRPSPQRVSIKTPEDVAAAMRLHGLLDHERFWCLPLDPRSRLIGRPLMVSVGDVDGTEAGPRSFMRAALRCGAVAVVAVHNHPSGDTAESTADMAVTRRLVEAGKAVDIRFDDHVILARDGTFNSLRRTRPEAWR